MAKTKSITIDKKKFDALLQKMLQTPPLPREELRGKSKSKPARVSPQNRSRKSS
jgi:hypothetical protein